MVARLGMIVLVLLAADSVFGDQPIVIADFDSEDYGTWTVVGEAFGSRPASGTLPGQMRVEGYLGKGLVNSFNKGDGTTGKLTSAAFKIDRKYITFLIGGGGWTDETCMNLLVDGKMIRTATGPNTEAGGSEKLVALAWDVSDLQGTLANIAIIDEHRGGWGHINVDHIVMTNELGSIPIATPPTPAIKNATREILVDKGLLLFPVKNGGKKRVVSVMVDEKIWQRFDIELADAAPDWWAPLDTTSIRGKSAQLVVNSLPEDSQGLKQIELADESKDPNLYAESLRSQFHFSPKRGWTNDPNGLVYYNGEYHLFFQHNPYGWNWGNMHWGHATSTDMVHWVEHGEALYPDELGPMFSGSAVVDWNNTSGFGKDGKPPLVLIYTAAGNPTTQCIAFSNDGRSFTKYDGNPVIKEITGGNRDPKVIWHSATKQWIMVLYVELDKQHTVHFFTSPNLRDWTMATVSKGGRDADKFLFECPDLFPLSLDGAPSQSQWILTAANSEYAIGQFDGREFTAKATKIEDVRGRGFYAAQTFSDMPDGRRIQIGWCQAPSPGMAFNQLQSLPCELTLRTTANGPRLHRSPIRELRSLRAGPNQADSLASFRSDLIEIQAEFRPVERLEISVRGAKVGYDPDKQQLHVNDFIVPAPLIAGKQKLQIYVDRTLLEVFASDGLTYVPMPFIPKLEDQSVRIDAGAKKQMDVLEVFELNSIWRKAQR